MRRKKPLRPTKRKNIFSVVKDDASREDPSRTAARAIRAIIGAVYEMEMGGVVSYSCLTFWVGDNEESNGIT